MSDSTMTTPSTDDCLAWLKQWSEGSAAYDVAQATIAQLIAGREAVRALDTLVGICKTDLETHLGNKTGKQIRAALAAARKAGIL